MTTSPSPLTYIRSIASMLVFLVMFAIGTPIAVVLGILTLGRSSNFVVKYLGPAMVYPVLFVAGIRLKTMNHGFDFSRPAIFIINHSSTLDLFTMVALGLPRIRFVAKWEIQYNPLFFIIGRATGQIFIKRQNRDHSIATLQKAYIKLKKHDLSIMVAPEGSRKHEGIIGPFKKGAFRMAMDLQYPIVPIYFEGSHSLSLGGSLLTNPGVVTAHIHPAIETGSWKAETIDEHIAEVRALYLNWAGVIEEPTF